MGSAGSVGAQAVGVGKVPGEVTLKLTSKWSLEMGGVFLEGEREIRMRKQLRRAEGWTRSGLRAVNVTIG